LFPAGLSGAGCLSGALRVAPFPPKHAAFCPPKPSDRLPAAKPSLLVAEKMNRRPQGRRFIFSQPYFNRKLAKSKQAGGILA